MNVLLINCPVRVSAKPNLIPLGVGYISSTLKQAGHSVDIIDGDTYPGGAAGVDGYVALHAGKYDFIGISGIVTTYNYQRQLIRLIRERTDKPIICGGGCASVMDYRLLEAGATMAISGAGENQILQYVGSSLRYKTLDDIPWPDWAGLDMKAYLPNPIWGRGTGNASNVDVHPDMLDIKRSANMITSRGCPFSCYFCHDLFGRQYQQRSVDSVISEAAALRDQYGVDFIGFVDDNMMVSREWMLDFCDKMQGQGLLWGCHARVNEVSEELLDAAYYAGCRWIGYGIESGSQYILDKMNKQATVRQARAAIRMTRDHDIYPNTSFIFGYPGETKKTVDETADFCNDLDIKPAFFYANPYPGSRLFEENKLRILERFGGMEPFLQRLGEAKDFVINLTDMPDERLFGLKEYLDGRVQNGKADA